MERMKVYIVRHGESEANAKNLYQHKAVKLSQRGIEQAQKVAQRFLTIPIEIIYSSSFERAKQTAEIIGNTIHKEVELLPLLTEIKRPPVIEGKKRNEPHARDIMRRIFNNWHNPNWRHSDEETFFDLKRRALQLLQHLETLHRQQILLVSHGTFMRVLLCAMVYGEKLRPRDFEPYLRFLATNNTGLTVCEYSRGNWRLLTWNDQAHLG